MGVKSCNVMAALQESRDISLTGGKLYSSTILLAATFVPFPLMLHALVPSLETSTTKVARESYLRVLLDVVSPEIRRPTETSSPDTTRYDALDWLIVCKIVHVCFGSEVFDQALLCTHTFAVLVRYPRCCGKSRFGGV